jgi:hypothetical protein
MKMLVSEWTPSGRIIWCNAKPVVKEQLNSVLQDPVYCDSDELRTYLLGK